MIFPWGDERRFNSYKHFLLKRFGTRVQKLTLDAGFSCPNRDGTIGTSGCTYCLNAAFNPSYCSPAKSIPQQLEEGILFHRNRYRRAGTYLAYFQAFSNTHAPLEQLREIYQPAIEHPEISGIVIGTRPDCVDDEKLDYFARLGEQMFVSIEYGVESCHDETLQHIRRGHDLACAQDAIARTVERGIHCAAHFIYGLPGETPDQWLDDLNLINALPIHGIKFHQLQIIQGTPMQQEYTEHPDRFFIFTPEKYIQFIVRIIGKLRPDLVVERFAGEVPPRFLHINHWGLTRYDVILQKIEKELERQDCWQGKYWQS
ncbi:MAG: TIGR01212 family radical SAM protein [Bacteroidales bacterium]|nr:TIGR01212 family radical SAM protein [Bacteroidales bacterium]